MKSISIISRLTLLENGRKQIFQALMLLLLVVVAASTLLFLFTDGVRMQMLKDLCSTSITVGGSLLAVVLCASGIQSDIENRTITPFVARPMTKQQYFLGKFFGNLLTVAVGMLGMVAVFAILLIVHGVMPDRYFALAVSFTMLQVAVIAAFTAMLSSFLSPVLAGMLGMLFIVGGSMKVSGLAHMIDSSPSIVTRVAMTPIYHILPNMGAFNFKTMLVQGIGAPPGYCAWVLVYGLLYIAICLMIGGWCISARDV